MDSTEYIENIQIVVDEITQANPDATFIFISPWLALENDPYTKLDTVNWDDMLAEYG